MIATRTLPSAADTRFHVALLHGFSFSAAMWDRMATHLGSLRDDTTLHLIDFPGYGDATEEKSWSMEVVARQICNAMQGKGVGKFILGGLSMGGYATFAFYRAYPSMIEGLVFSNTRAAADSDEGRKNREDFAQDALKRGDDAVLDRLYSQFVSDATDPEIAIEIRRWIAEASPEANAAALRAMAVRRDSTDLLPLITAPSLVITGSRDEIIEPRAMREMAAKLTSSTFVEIENASHLSAAEFPSEWAQALSSFLDRL